jgi:hypothetical protein
MVAKPVLKHNLSSPNECEIARLLLRKKLLAILMIAAHREDAEDGAIAQKNQALVNLLLRDGDTEE